MRHEMKSMDTKQEAAEIISDGRTVWVNDEVGNIGRFSWTGIDVHPTIIEQMDGASECLACTHGLTHLADWRNFQSLMKQHYHVDVSDRHMPAFIRNELRNG
jgi:hypothetical protein